MITRRGFLFAVGAIWFAVPTSGTAQDTAPPQPARDAEVVFLGEQHDNPGHHRVQADWVRELAPAALVFEMLTAEQAAGVSPEARETAAGLSRQLKWERSGWPDFEMYFPIFAAAPGARIYGAALGRAALGDMSPATLAALAGQPELDRFGVSRPLDPEAQARRESLQRAAHCDALPESLVPGMVTVQRLRDAMLAEAALRGLRETSGPVAVITGNGHARADWGAPRYLREAAPGVAVFALGQGEAGLAPEGLFDLVLDGPAVDRGDPCDAFR